MNGTVRKVDPYAEILLLADGTAIPFEELNCIEKINTSNADGLLVYSVFLQKLC